MAETKMIGEDSENGQRACRLPSTKFDHNATFICHSSNQESRIIECNAIGLEEDETEIELSESAPLLPKNDHNISIGKIQENKKGMAIKTGVRKTPVNHNGIGDNSDALNMRTNLQNHEMINRESVVPYKSPGILGDHSNCRLLTLSLKHMVKTIFVTSPIIICVCLVGFCLSKVPYTNNCSKYSTEHDCIYYNKHILIGIDQIMRLVSA